MALKERVPLGTRSERFSQTEERQRNGITFQKEGTEQDRNAQTPFPQIFSKD